MELGSGLSLSVDTFKRGFLQDEPECFPSYSRRGAREKLHFWGLLLLLLGVKPKLFPFQ